MLWWGIAPLDDVELVDRGGRAQLARHQALDVVLRRRDDPLGPSVDGHDRHVVVGQLHGEAAALLGVQSALYPQPRPLPAGEIPGVDGPQGVLADGQRLREAPGHAGAVDDGHVVGQEPTLARPEELEHGAGLAGVGAGREHQAPAARRPCRPHGAACSPGRRTRTAAAPRPRWCRGRAGCGPAPWMVVTRIWAPKWMAKLAEPRPSCSSHRTVFPSAERTMRVRARGVPTLPDPDGDVGPALSPTAVGREEVGQFGQHHVAADGHDPVEVVVVAEGRAEGPLEALQLGIETPPPPPGSDRPVVGAVSAWAIFFSPS